LVDIGFARHFRAVLATALAMVMAMVMAIVIPRRD
jgi:hypothetical protein